MRFERLLWLAIGTALGASLACAGEITYTCAPNVDQTEAGTCAYLNSTVAGYYNATFSNANADIYIQMGNTGLGENTTGYFNLVPYSTYLTALTNEDGPGIVRSGALASLPLTEPSLYNGGEIEVTSALGDALGLSGMIGTTASGAQCYTPGIGGCYNGIITITTPANLLAETGNQGLYWDQNGGTIPGLDYDFYSIVEHESDEVLGTSSCIDTTTSALIDGCGGTNASAVDLFRYTNGSRVFISTAAGAYFSYNGGISNGVPTGAVYNTLANGDDYADFAASCANVQDATGCLGSSLNITTDGGGEINILDAVGYNLAAPEPGTPALLGAGLSILALYRRRRRA